MLAFMRVRFKVTKRELVSLDMSMIPFHLGLFGSRGPEELLRSLSDSYPSDAGGGKGRNGAPRGALWATGHRALPSRQQEGGRYGVMRRGVGYRDSCGQVAHFHPGGKMATHCDAERLRVSIVHLGYFLARHEFISVAGHC
jgi:hypothetical protein